MPSYVYFNAYNPNDAPGDYQRTGSTATWIDNEDTTGFQAYTGDNEFWPSPDVRQQNWNENQDLIICWADDSVANTTSKGGTAKVSYWKVSYSATEVGYLDWMNEAIRCSGGAPQISVPAALAELVIAGCWTNYTTDIPAGIIG